MTSNLDALNETAYSLFQTVTVAEVTFVIPALEEVPVIVPLKAPCETARIMSFISLRAPH